MWLPNHQLEHTTRQRYSYQIGKYLLPKFGAMRMRDIAPVHVRERITRLKDQDVSASTIADLKTVLSAIFTTALNDQIAAIHPCRGVKTPTVARKPRTIVSPEQFDLIHSALPEPRWRMLVELDVESGLRWGELTELRVRDFNSANRMLTVARAVVEINKRFREADAPRFVVKDYPKDKEYRRVKLSPEIATLLREHVQTNRLGRDDLLFAMPEPEPEPDAVAAAGDAPPPDLKELGRTEPNTDGRTYPHGTVTAYNLGGCRCTHCRDACARYRAQRRKDGKDDPRNGGLGRKINTDGHIPRRWFAQHIWTPAVQAAGLDFTVRVHDLRHAPTPPGSSPAAPTSKPSKNASATPACAPPRNTSTPSPTTTTPPSPTTTTPPSTHYTAPAAAQHDKCLFTTHSMRALRARSRYAP
ncbi:MAG TPA: site-specific integrase [Jatrophihabitans sp.]|nr:site-specific integrase [Jatrophihabitans sp.]